MADSTAARTTVDDGLQDSSAAFNHALLFGRKVAHALAAAGVPEDSYVVQERRDPPPKEVFGFRGLGEVVRVPTAERREPIGGWRAHSQVLEEFVPADSAGRPTGPVLARTERQLWLLRSGELRDVLLSTDAGGAVRVVSSGPLSPDGARALASAGEWDESLRRERGSTMLHRTRRDVGAVDTADSALVLSGVLMALQSRGH